MKRCFVLALLFGSAMAVSAQSSLDLISRSRLRQQRLVIKQERTTGDVQMKVRGGLSASATNMFGMVKLDSGTSVEALEAEGVKVVGSRGDFAFVSVPIDDVERVASLKGVKRFQLARPVSAKNDRARVSTGVDKIQAGVGLGQPYTGKGVVCGVVDNGIDPNHVNFRDESGNSRVGFLAQLKANRYTGEVEEKFYGNYVSESVKDIKTFTTDDNTTYHGSHTLGTMAGGYKGKAVVASGDAQSGVTVGEMDNPYYGVACESDIAVGCGDLYDAIIAYGANYVSEYARYNHKPVVINLSLGSNSGAHDGKGMINQFFDLLAKEDSAIICVSAGNEGDMKIALNKEFKEGDGEVKTFILGTDMSAAGYGYMQYGNVEIYSRDSSALDIQAVIFNKKRGRVVQRYPLDVDLNNPGSGRYWVSSEDFQQVDEDVVDAQFARFFKGYIGIGWNYDEDSKRFYAIVDYYASNNTEGDANSDGNYVLGFIVKGSEGQRADLFCDGLFSSLTDFGIDGWDDGMYNGTISDMATGNSTLVVGSYNTRESWAAIDGNPYYSGYDMTEGEVSTFSSFGTLIDGRNLPHVCAPGAAIISSMNSYFVDAGNADRSQLNAELDEVDRKNYWGWSAGTSMSTPHVAGSVALWLEADPTLTIKDVKDIVAKTSVKDAFMLSADPVQVGAGKFNAYEGLKEVLRRGSTGIGNVSSDKPKMLVNALGHNVFNVFLAGAKTLDVAVYHVTGSLAVRKSVSGDETDVDLSSLPSGMYVLSVNGQAAQKIMIK